MNKNQQNQQITGNNNIQVGGDLTINLQEAKSKPTRVNFTPDYNVHISEAEAKAISDKIHDLSKLADDISCIKMLFGKLKSHFQIATYRALPKELFDEAIHYLDIIAHTKILPTARKNNNPAWRNSNYKAIHAKARELGWSNDELHQRINQWLGHKKQYSSMTELSGASLNQVYKHIMGL